MKKRLTVKTNGGRKLPAERRGAEPRAEKLKQNLRRKKAGRRRMMIGRIVMKRWRRREGKGRREGRKKNWSTRYNIKFLKSSYVNLEILLDPINTYNNRYYYIAFIILHIYIVKMCPAHS